MKNLHTKIRIIVNELKRLDSIKPKSIVDYKCGQYTLNKLTDIIEHLTTLKSLSNDTDLDDQIKDLCELKTIFINTCDIAIE